MNRQTWLALLLCTLLLLPNLGRAATLAEAVEEATRNLAQGRIDQSTERKIIVQVVNKASQKTDDLSGRVETELYRTLAKAFPSFELVSLSEAQGGVNLSKVVVVRGETEPRGVLVGLKIFASVGLKGTLLAQAQTEFENTGKGRKQLVAVLDLEGPDLTEGQRTAFSEVFRTGIAQSGEFELASSAEVSKMSPDAIQKTQGCTRDECATIIGEQLGLDRVISSSVSKIDENHYQVSAKILNVKDGTILKSATLAHEDKLSTLDQSLLKLVTRLTNRQVADLGIDAMLAAQAQARNAELAKIAAERNKIKKAQLENEASWREIARQAELNRAKWVVIDDSLSLEKAIADADTLRAEFAATEKKFETQWKKSQLNLAQASKLEKDPFETNAEFALRTKRARKEEEKRQLNEEATYFSQKIEVLEPIEQRLLKLQTKRFTLPEVKLSATLGPPDAETSTFPLTLSQGSRSWQATWAYQDKETAKALWATKSLLTVQAKATIQEGSKGKTSSVLVGAEVQHAGVGVQQNLELETPSPFPEVLLVRDLRTKLEDSRAKLKIWSAEAHREWLSLRTKLVPQGMYPQPNSELVWSIGLDDPETTGQDAGDFCKELVHGGQSDWRLPNLDELASIYDFQDANPKESQLLNFGEDDYWTSTVFADDEDYIWYLTFGNGQIAKAEKTAASFVRCVR